MVHRCVLTLTQVRQKTHWSSERLPQTLCGRTFSKPRNDRSSPGGNPLSPEVVDTEVGSTNTQGEQN